MAYRKDKDLEFLKNCTKEELNDLHYCLVYDKDGSTRYTETLTAKEAYKRYYPDHTKYWQDIAEELQTFGGNTLANIFRLGEGVLYKEVLEDVAKLMKIPILSYDDAENIENKLIFYIFQESWEKLTKTEKEEFLKEMGISTLNLSKQAVMAAVQASIKMGGFASYKLTLIVVNAISKILLGRGLSLAANASLMRVMGTFAGPIGWVITGLWTLIDIAGPATRVTVPAVFCVSLMRKQVEMKKLQQTEKFQNINNSQTVQMGYTELKFKLWPF